jgi:hypothetical protein
MLAGALAIAPLVLAFGAGGIAVGLAPTGGLVTMKALTPKFDHWLLGASCAGVQCMQLYGSARAGRAKR